MKSPDEVIDADSGKVRRRIGFVQPHVVSSVYFLRARESNARGVKDMYSAPCDTADLRQRQLDDNVNVQEQNAAATGFVFVIGEIVFCVISEHLGSYRANKQCKTRLC